MVSAANVTWWGDRSMWITSHSVPLFNIWYYSARLMPLYRARRLNATGQLGVTLPPLSANDALYVPSDAQYHVDSTWEQLFTDVVTGVRGMPRQYLDSPLIQRFKSPEQLLCMKSAVVLGAFAYVVWTRCIHV